MKRSFELVKTFKRLFLFPRRFQNGCGSKITEQFMVMPKINLTKFQVKIFVNFFEILSTFLYLVELLGQHGLVIDNIPDSKTLETDKEYTECS